MALLIGMPGTRPGMTTMVRLIVSACLALAALGASARAEDINSFRRAHGLHALSMSSTLAAMAAEQASAMAGRNHLDHDGFRQRFAFSGGRHAENVAYGCDTEECAIRMWSRSAGHRRNMLLRDVSAYGIASATGAKGRRYWALELGN
jgi:uncharacterized protein YkwD